MKVSRTYQSWSADPGAARCVFAEARNLGSEVKCTRSRDHVQRDQIRGNEPCDLEIDAVRIAAAEGLGCRVV